MVRLLRCNLVDLPVSLSLKYFWCGGVSLGVVMLVQVFSGIILSFFYRPDRNFYLVFMVRDENIFSWLMRYVHVWCVNLLFVLLIVHVGRSVYYCRYKRLGV